MSGQEKTDPNERPTQWPVRVRVSQFPDKELEVDEAEWTNLSASGLLVETLAPVKLPPRKTEIKE
jgi:hypothetical protein